MSTDTLVRPQPNTPTTQTRLSGRPRLGSPWLWLPVILTGQAALALRPGPNVTAFEDEGLYVFMGHRMIDHFLHGAFLPEFPGGYFSGAPGIYPVLAAMVDNVGGLQAVRGLSLFFAMLATLGTYGVGSRLFGRLAGLLGALAFVLCGSVIFQSHLATYDAMTMALVALAAWLAVYSAQRDGLLWGPVLAAILALAALTKYAGAVYAPMVVALAVAVGWPRLRWLIVRRGIFVLVAASVMFFFVIQLWGRDLVGGIEQTTLSRSIINPASKETLLTQTAQWVGPWLGLAALAGLLRLRRQWLVVGVLLFAAIVGPLEQVRIGEATSLAKHTAFGMVFAAPLIGDLFARALRRSWPLALLPSAAAMVSLGALGVHSSGMFLTGWIQDTELRPVVSEWAKESPGRAILGEHPSAIRYELRDDVAPRLWTDTYALSFNGKEGTAAYADALRLHYFGVIYLDSSTDNGAFVLHELTKPGRDRYYNIKAKIPRYLRGERVGEWLVFAPRSTSLRQR